MSSALPESSTLPWPPDASGLRLLQAIGDGCVAADRAGRILWANGRASSLLNIPDTELALLPVWAVFPTLRGTIEAVGTLGKPERAATTMYEVDIYQATDDGTVIFFRPAAMHEAARDRFLMEVVPQMVWTESADRRVEYINHHLETYTGLTLQELQGGEGKAIIHPEDLPRVFAMREQSLVDGQGYENEYRIRRSSDGMFRWHLVQVRRFNSPDGRKYWLGTALDIHDRRMAEQALRTSEEWQRIAVEAGNVGLWDWDVLTGEVTWSDRVYAIHGLEQGQFGGTVDDFASLVHPVDTPIVQEALAEALGGKGTYQVEFRHVRGDGDVRWITTEGRVVFDEESKPVRMMGAAIDTTDRKRYEQALTAANAELSRINSDLEQFAYAAAHDLQEPLRMVSIYTELLAQRYRGQLDERAHSYITQTRTSARRMKQLVEDLLAYTRLIHAQPEPPADVDIGDLIESEVLPNLALAIDSSSASITIESLPAVKASRVRMTQLFQNLIGNAIKYRRPRVSPEIHVTASRRNSLWVFSVRDNGIGIRAEYHERIFGVFRRLHGPEIDGTGIGLAICRRIVEYYGGKIWVESAEGQGSAFCFTLPAAQS